MQVWKSSLRNAMPPAFPVTLAVPSALAADGDGAARRAPSEAACLGGGQVSAAVPAPLAPVAGAALPASALGGAGGAGINGSNLMIANKTITGGAGTGESGAGAAGISGSNSRS